MADAIKGLELVRSVRARGEDWTPFNNRESASVRLGHYRIDRIEKNGTVHAGCHTVPWTEIERIAPQLENVESLAV